MCNTDTERSLKTRANIKTPDTKNDNTNDNAIVMEKAKDNGEGLAKNADKSNDTIVISNGKIKDITHANYNSNTNATNTDTNDGRKKDEQSATT